MRPINLLPPEVAGEARKRRRVLMIGAVAGIYGLLLVLGVFYWNTRVDAARSDVTAQQEVNQTLEREVVTLSEASQLRTEYLDKADLVRGALDADIEWGIILNDLARLLPPRVWVENFSGSVVRNGPVGVLGQVSFSGVAFEFPDVSSWLRALDSDEFVGISGTWVSTATEGVIGSNEVVSFSSSAVLTEAASSDRADSMIPEVP